MKRVVLLLLLIILSTAVMAQTGDQYHLKLLAVQDNNGKYIGSDADLFLELKDRYIWENGFLLPLYEFKGIFVLTKPEETTQQQL